MFWKKNHSDPEATAKKIPIASSDLDLVSLIARRVHPLITVTEIQSQTREYRSIVIMLDYPNEDSLLDLAKPK